MGSHFYFKVPDDFIDFLPKLSESAVKIYLVFRRMYNETKNNDRVWPSYKSLMALTGLSKKSISNGIHELIKFGWISDIAKGKNYINEYHINDSSNINPILINKRDNLRIINSTRAKKRQEEGKSLFGGVKRKQRLCTNVPYRCVNFTQQAVYFLHKKNTNIRRLNKNINIKNNNSSSVYFTQPISILLESNKNGENKITNIPLEPEECHTVTKEMSQCDSVTEKDDPSLEAEVSRGIPEIDLRLPPAMVMPGHYWCRGNFIEIIKEDRISQVYYTDENGQQTSWPWREFVPIAKAWDITPKGMGVSSL